MKNIDVNPKEYEKNILMDEDNFRIITENYHLREENKKLQERINRLTKNGDVTNNTTGT